MSLEKSLCKIFNHEWDDHLCSRCSITFLDYVCEALGAVGETRADRVKAALVILKKERNELQNTIQTDK